jgi:hypothetical protein
MRERAEAAQQAEERREQTRVVHHHLTLGVRRTPAHQTIG